jgi:hypothetical protein
MAEPTKVKEVELPPQNLGIEGNLCRIGVSGKFTGKNGVCLQARFFYNQGENPGKNGIFVPIDYAEEFIGHLVDAVNQATGANLAIIGFTDQSES